MRIMKNRSDMEGFVINRMIPGKWYPVKKENVIKLARLIPMLIEKDIELTFNGDRTKVKKTIWEKGKPKL